VIILIIEIDGYFHQDLLTGKKCTRQQLIVKYLQAKELTIEVKDLHNLFCRLHNFEQILYNNELRVDFIIDTDTDRIYAPIY
jgi:hypothetical protein